MFQINFKEVFTKHHYFRNDGDYVLSKTSNGTSKVCLESNFLAKSDADWMFETLLNEVQWKQQFNQKYNEKEKRLTAWFSKYSYSYSGVSQELNTNVNKQNFMIVKLIAF